MPSMWGRFMAGVRAFREAFMSSDIADPDDWADFTSRQTRYAVLWAFYENTAYRNVHSWSTGLRSAYGMYKYSRNIYNPAYRLGSFWQTHLWGGALDMAAGDGTEVPSAMPIVTANERLRPAIGQVWRNSNWMSRKGIATLWGATMGDVGLRVIDDTDRKKTYIGVVHPSSIESVDLDPFGNCKGYVLREARLDPVFGREEVWYREEATREGDEVVYRTYKNDALFGWDGLPAEWAEPYGFVPFVLVKHNDVGMDWGWAELFPALSKVREVDDLASKISDQVRKMVDAPWLFAGVEKPRTTPTTTGTAASVSSKAEPGREEIPALYGPVGATATPLVAQLDLAAATGHVAGILAEIERDYPELKQDSANATGDRSGLALEIDHQPIEDKVIERRANYDDGLMRVQQMAVAIGGFRNYDGFSGFDLDSYGRGDLDHTIDPMRPVFRETPSMRRAREQQELAIEIQRMTIEQQRSLGTGR